MYAEREQAKKRFCIFELETGAEVHNTAMWRGGVWGAKLFGLARLDPDSLHERFTYLFLFVCLFIIFCPLFALNFRVYTTTAGKKKEERGR